MAVTKTAQKIRSSKAGTLLWTASGNQSIVDLPRGYVWREIVLELSGLLTTAANLSAANIKCGDEWAMIKRVDIIASGTEYIRSYTGEELMMLNFLWYGARQRQHIAIGGQSTSFDSCLIIPFWDVRASRPLDTALNTGGYQSLQIVITWGAASDITSASTPAFSGTPQVDVYYQGSTGYAGPFLESRVSRGGYTVAGSAENNPNKMPIGQMAYRSILVYGKDSSVNDLATYFSKIRFKSGPTVLHDLSWNAAKALQLNRYSCATAQASSAELAIAQSSSTNLDAWVLFDFAPDGRILTESYDVRAVSEFILDIKSTGAINAVNYVAHWLVPGRASYAPVAAA